jgi:hypothetical protein
VQYLNDSFRAGLLSTLDAVSVHPYGDNVPEAALHDYPRVRDLIAAYSPPGKAGLPVIESEWGWTTAVNGANACWGRSASNGTAAKYLVRQFLVNLIASVNVSVNYDWQDGTAGPSDCESNYGAVTTVRNLGPDGGPFIAKPKYTAARMLKQLVGRSHFAGRWQPSSLNASEARNVFIVGFQARRRCCQHQLQHGMVVNSSMLCFAGRFVYQHSFHSVDQCNDVHCTAARTTDPV